MHRGREGYLLNVDAVTGTAEDETCSHGFCEASCLDAISSTPQDMLETGPYLIADLLLVFSWEVDKMIVLCANQERDSRLVEASSLSVPFLDTVQGRFAGEVEHEEDSHCIIADEREHIDELSLPTEIPYGECDFSVAD